MIYACKEHLEEAIDQFIYENETSPDMGVLETEEEICFLCQQKAYYSVSSFNK